MTLIYTLLRHARHSLCSNRSLHSRTNAPYSHKYDVIVVGGGHAGCEAAHASARMGCLTLLLTHKRSTIGEMSCNPSFGGIGKGHLMKEVDALDGVCGRICDKSGIHFKMLNRSKGPAVWGPRAQIDRELYKKNMQEEILNTDNLTVLEGSVDDLIIEEMDVSDPSANVATLSKCRGVVMQSGQHISGTCVILTAGTFLRGQVNMGLQHFSAGRRGDEPAIRLAETIERLGFVMGRLKTGSPPRLQSNSVDFRPMTIWKPDPVSHPFSFMNDEVWIPVEDQVDCYTTHTSPEVKSIVEETLHLNSHVNEEVNGPRYCPSIESKVLRFPERSHTLWIEPEELDTKTVYLQGFSCTMPEEHQVRAVRCIKGLENAIFTKSGYGVEYDYMDPRQVAPTLETKKVQSLFFAGQINGTTGYEEAAAQGIMAGINAARKAQQKPFFYISRSDGYIGVLIDDLTTHGTNEPYRMFTSRAEYRLSLRSDNADSRLTLKAYSEAGCVSEARKQRTERTSKLIEHSIALLKGTYKSRNEWAKVINVDLISTKSGARSAFSLIANPGGNSSAIFNLFGDELKPVIENVSLQERIAAIALYEAMSSAQRREIDELQKEEGMLIPEYLDYSKLPLRVELCEKLTKSRPVNIAAASRIQGMTPTALLRLIGYIKSSVSSYS